MSIQWKFVAAYLYFEIAIVAIMILPFISPRRWHRFFNSRFIAVFKEHAAMYFYSLLGILALFLVDAVREMRKYSHSSDGSHLHLANEMKGNVKLFRAQRNFYITGFAIFLAFVIRRLASMLIIQHEISLKAEKIIRQAEDTVKHAKSVANQSSNYDDIRSQLEHTKDLLEEEKIKSSYYMKEFGKLKKKNENIQNQQNQNEEDMISF